jgi:hypothetical protein
VTTQTEMLAQRQQTWMTWAMPWTSAEGGVPARIHLHAPVRGTTRVLHVHIVHGGGLCSGNPYVTPALGLLALQQSQHTPQPGTRVVKRLEAWQQVVPSPYSSVVTTGAIVASGLVSLTNNDLGGILLLPLLKKQGGVGICLYLCLTNRTLHQPLGSSVHQHVGSRATFTHALRQH